MIKKKNNMPKCSYCKESGHTKRTCGKGTFDRLMSIMNNGSDIESISAVSASIQSTWFTDNNGSTPVSPDYKSVSSVRFTQPSEGGRAYGSMSTEITIPTTGVDNVSRYISSLIRVLYWLKKDIFESSWVSSINQRIYGEETALENKKFVFGKRSYNEYKRFSVNEVDGYEVRLLDDNTFTYRTCKIKEQDLHRTGKEIFKKICEICNGFLFITDERERSEMIERWAVMRTQNERVRQNRDNELMRLRRERVIESQRLSATHRVEQEQRRQRQAEERLCEVKEKVIEASECPICMDELGETNKVILRCGHQLCGDCIFKHVQNARGTQCPCCRAEYTYRPSGWVPPNNGAPRSSGITGNQVSGYLQRISHLEGFIRDLVGVN